MSLREPHDFISLEPVATKTGEGIASPAAGQFPSFFRRWLSSQHLGAPFLINAVRLIDILAVGLAALLAFKIYIPQHGDLADSYVITTLLVAFLMSQLLSARGAYRLEKLTQFQAQIGLLLTSLAIVCAILVSGAFLLKMSGQFSRGWALLSLCLYVAQGIGLRILVHQLLSNRTTAAVFSQRALIVGATEIGRRVMQRVDESRPRRLNVLGIFDDRAAGRDQAATAAASEGQAGLLGRIDQIPDFVRKNTVDVVIVALPLMAEKRVLQILAVLQQLPVDVRFATDLVGFNIANPVVSNIAGIPMLHAADAPFRGWRAIAKDIEDRTLAALLLVLLAPLMLLIALAIKLDSPGPALFRQPRRGFNSKAFNVYKFRTMRHELADTAGNVLTQRNDSRITKLGAFLRKTSLDELPQLLNVLAGQMSIGGPRPHAHGAKAADKLYPAATANYMARYRVKPGITGWAQVNGWRGPTDSYEQLRQRVEHDLYYIENWSVWLDLRIIAMTPFAALWGKNAF
jgi:Undecaprenyl-phosphate glucose phosphotransferase